MSGTVCLTHLLPDIPAAEVCLGRTVLFCQLRRLSGAGETDCRLRTPQRSGPLCVSYARVFAVGDHCYEWTSPGLGGHYETFLAELEVVKELVRHQGRLQAVVFQSGEPCEVEAMFTTRGDLFHTALAEERRVEMEVRR